MELMGVPPVPPTRENPDLLCRRKIFNSMDIMVLWSTVKEKGGES